MDRGRRSRVAGRVSRVACRVLYVAGGKLATSNPHPRHASATRDPRPATISPIFKTDILILLFQVISVLVMS